MCRIAQTFLNNLTKYPCDFTSRADILLGLIGGSNHLKLRRTVSFFMYKGALQYEDANLQSIMKEVRNECRGE